MFKAAIIFIFAGLAEISDLYDWIDASICVIGVSVMLWAPRS